MLVLTLVVAPMIVSSVGAAGNYVTLTNADAKE